ncbi:hypothetical protein PA598K_04446 [Paenibacillus sp. 598K]|uniref:glycosyltransferase family 2 protein n=1 Tax=Paenibacillus sp. 598K TaxID=1117987 RepID=UPI000FF9BAA0|nr:glycosyltransferase [Paenibacillus sp. 598K]GBF76007.1 hypothetical protein PA598K_04446 [Paenibacillus sp. 598K]
MITVIIPTYKRTNSLLACLKGLQRQLVLPDEVIVVVRDTDFETIAALRQKFTPLTVRVTIITVTGTVAALNKGLASSKGDIIAITDDDTVPRKEWLYHIQRNFNADPEVGGVGGRDWVHSGGVVLNGEKERIGRIHWFGKVVGNHHLGTKVQEVDLLKGANMSYRRKAISGIWFDERLKGNGAQVHNDMAFSLEVKRAGWKLVYDPLVAVDHFPAQRFDEDKRNSFNSIAQYNSAYNETLTIQQYLGPFKSKVFLLWSVFIGTSTAPGLLQVFRLFVTGKYDHLLKKFIATQRGRWNANGISTKGRI